MAQQYGSYDQGGYNQSGYGQQNRYDRYNQQAGNPYSQPSGALGREQQRPQEYMPQSNEMGDGIEMHNRPRDTFNPMDVLNECRDTDRAIDAIYQNLERLQYLQQQSLDDPDASQNTRVNRELDSLNAETITLYRNLADRVTRIKKMKGAGHENNVAQVRRVDNKLKEAINKYQQVDTEFRKKLQAQMARQYRIVRPDASEAEVREACEDTSGGQVFSQALLQSDRRGQSQSALRAVQGRHVAIQKIEQQVTELAELFRQVNELVVVQEAQTQQISTDAENVMQNVESGNKELGGAVIKARAARRKKWICLGICIAIIAVIIIIILVVLAVQGKLGNNKGS